MSSGPSPEPAALQEARSPRRGLLPVVLGTGLWVISFPLILMMGAMSVMASDAGSNWAVDMIIRIGLGWPLSAIVAVVGAWGCWWLRRPRFAYAFLALPAAWFVFMLVSWSVLSRYGPHGALGPPGQVLP